MSKLLRFFILLISMTFLLILSGFFKDVTAQTSSRAPKTKPAARASILLTSDGQPNLEGIWNFATITPLERPPELAGKEFLTEQEAEDWARKRLDELNFDRRDGGPEENIRRGYNEYWAERGPLVKTSRSSLIIDPPDGKVPALTEEGQKREKEQLARSQIKIFEGPEDFALTIRCIRLQGAGPPIQPSLYNNNVRIQQGPGYVAILHEMNHEARIIPLDGRPHLPPQVHQWNGDSRGHWEGDTLVVETTNFMDRSAYLGGNTRYIMLDSTSQNMRLTERFKRLDENTLRYRFTIDDPSTFVRPWTVEVPATKTEGPLLEYACHEGNDVVMTDALEASRVDEKKVKQGSQK